MRVELPSKGISGTLILPPGGFDFTSQLAASETIVSAVTTAVNWWGTDPSPSAIISGAVVISGSLVFQTFTAGVLGNIYLVTCSALTSASRTLILAGYLAIVPDY